MKPRKRSFKRTSGVRDAKLIIIASEGEATEKLYFEGVAANGRFRNTRVHVKVLDRGSGNSDPAACLRSLINFKTEYHLNKEDELWLVCDVDRWGDRKLSEVNRLCRQKGFFISVSNPCFELWLLCHFVSVSSFDNEKKSELLSGCRKVIDELKKAMGGYKKTSIDLDKFIERIPDAIDESEKLDMSGDWPVNIGTRVSKLMKSIIKLT